MIITGMFLELDPERLPEDATPIMISNISKCWPTLSARRMHILIQRLKDMPSPMISNGNNLGWRLLAGARSNLNLKVGFFRSY